jgi:hypothetical protein
MLFFIRTYGAECIGIFEGFTTGGIGKYKQETGR